MTLKSLLSNRFVVFCLFFISVNLLSGYLAVYFDYPSLFNVNASFGEYAIPLPFTWALAHWPSILVFVSPLLHPSHTSSKKVALYYRLFCAVSFVLLLFMFEEKIPFLLFPTVDALMGLICSLLLVPPTRHENPILFPMTLASGVVISSVVIYLSYNYWQHRTPVIRNASYLNGLFELTSIVVRKPLHEMQFSMDLKERLIEETACERGKEVAEIILVDYPFDSDYRQFIEVWFNPSDAQAPESNGSPYRLGEISLNIEDRERDGSLPCYMSYK